METKKCTRCNKSKELSEFYIIKITKVGYISRCKACLRKQDEERRAAKKAAAQALAKKEEGRKNGKAAKDRKAKKK